MVRYASTVFQRNFISANIKSSVDSRRITTDQLAAKTLGDFDSQRTLSSCSWTDDRDQNLGLARQSDGRTAR